MAAFFTIDGKEIEWHVGEPLPDGVFNQRVLKLQIDGDELLLLEQAILRLCRN